MSNVSRLEQWRNSRGQGGSPLDQVASQVLPVVILIVAAIIVYSYVTSLFVPAFGLSYMTPGMAVTSVYEGGPGAQAGIRPGDVLLQVKNTPSSNLVEFERVWRQLPVNQPAAVLIQRGNQQLALTITPRPNDFFIDGLVVFHLVALIFWVIGLFVYISQYRNRAGSIFLVYCLSTALGLATAVDNTQSAWAPVLFLFAFGLTVGSLYHLLNLIPTHRPTQSLQRRLSIQLTYLLSLIAVVVALIGRWRGSEIIFQIGLTLIEIILALALLMAFLGLWRDYRKTPETSPYRAAYYPVVGGLLLGLLPFIFMFIVATLQGFQGVDPRLAVLSLGVFPISLAYGALRYRVIGRPSQPKGVDFMLTAITRLYWLLLATAVSLSLLTQHTPLPPVMIGLLVLIAILHPIAYRLIPIYPNSALHPWFYSLVDLVISTAVFYLTGGWRGPAEILAYGAIGLAALRFPWRITFGWVLVVGTIFTLPLSLMAIAEEAVPWESVVSKWGMFVSEWVGYFLAAYLLNYLARMERETILEKVNAERRLAEVEALERIGRALSATLNLDKLLPIILDEAMSATSARWGVLFLSDPSQSYPMIGVSRGCSERELKDLEAFDVYKTNNIIRFVQETEQALLIPDVPHWDDFIELPEVAPDLPYRPLIPKAKTEMAVPIVVSGQRRGILSLASDTTGAFTPANLSYISALAGSAAIALANAQRFTATDQALTARLRELSIMDEVARQLTSHLDLSEVINLVLTRAMSETGAERGLLGIVNTDRSGLDILVEGHGDRVYVPHPHRTWPIDQGVIGQVTQSGESCLSATSDDAPSLWESDRTVSARSKHQPILAVPIRREGQSIGIIYLERESSLPFTSDHLNFVKRLAEHATIAIQNARLYSELQQANVRLQELSQAKTEFVSAVSHELRTPMTSIKGYVDLLLLGAAGEITPAQSEFLQVIQHNTTRLADLVNDLLDISRIEAGRLHLRLQPLDLSDVIEEALSGVARRIEEKGLTLERQISGELPAIIGDRARLLQVISNLVDNAVKYTPDGGKITVTAHHDKDALLEVRVADTGIGISEKDQARLFEKFFRADHPLVREVAGTGLGLAITKGIVEMHGGRIWVESQLGQGSTFYCQFPIVNEGQAATFGTELPG